MTQIATTADTIVPFQREGGKSATLFTVNLRTFAKAEKIFLLARERLLEVNQWDQLCGNGSAAFRLTDEEGRVLKKQAETGLHIRIDLPAPGTIGGDGYDWVAIEKIYDDAAPQKFHQFTAIQVRPADNPLSFSGRTAHFFHEHATSTFLVEKAGTRITASVFGRNEKPNTVRLHWIDRIRNWFVAIAAMLGFAKPQWKRLTRGLLSYQKADLD